MLFFNKANDYTNPKYIGSRFRRKRFQFFESRLENLNTPISIIDIGGKVNFWVNEGYHNRYDVTITILNSEAEESEYFNIRTVVGDACNLWMFKADEFDIAFSNSLIEHLHTKENQIQMALEAFRVGKYFFIQTPNLYFPLEPHFKFPFFQFLPKGVKFFLLTRTSIINGIKHNRDYAQNIIEEIRLLSKAEFMQLFPLGELYIERFLWLTKSFVLHNLPKEGAEVSISPYSEIKSKMSS